MKRTLLISGMLIAISVIIGGCKNKTGQDQDTTAKQQWSIEKAQQWGDSIPWLRGSNFTPSTAINQLEFWQKETFDLVTIDRELGWAEEIGFNCMRVYLHHVAWQTDQKGFKHRLDQYLTVANKHHIKTIFVLFDDCWNPTYQAGKQPEPKPGIHNSGWIQDPGELIFEDESLMAVLENYTKDILSTFKDDNRIAMWDLYNEPGNNNKKNKSLPLLQNAFQWGWDVRPSQPLTAGVWSKGLTDLNQFQIENSDIITYHNYSNEVDHQQAIDSLKQYNRPLVCTEYMARRNNSRFQNIMPMLKNEKIGAINWGLVAGKTNTIYAWNTPIPDGSEPKLWFHDIFRPDGTPFDPEEIKLIKELTGQSE